ncbi:MAG: hypothetical protein EOO43_09285 [Flavobacterium sp.]|nr:MAG: hypothetical protein EOO43_09285 [Flavobacterium sp.]
MTVVEDDGWLIMQPTDEQVNHLLDLIQEYAFLLTKQLCIELKLPWAHTTYSMQNEMERWRSRFDLNGWGQG